MLVVGLNSHHPRTYQKAGEMSISTDIVTELLQAFPQICPQMYFKTSLTALSHAMEDLVLSDTEKPLIIASFQQERYYRQEARRYQRISEKTSQVYVLAAPETDFKNCSDDYETIAFFPEDSLSQQWHLVVVGKTYASCLVCRERVSTTGVDNNRRFEGVWTFDRQVSQVAAGLLLTKILGYRPELRDKVEEARENYLKLNDIAEKEAGLTESPLTNPDPFVQRLITYLQAGQYKLIKANRSLSVKEHRERLINSVTTAIRRSLDPDEILQVAVEKLGEGLGVCRCLVYRCEESDLSVAIKHEFINTGISSLKEKAWPLKGNPLFQEVIELRDVLKIDNTLNDPRLAENSTLGTDGTPLKNLIQACSIFSWLLVPIFYRDRLLGMMELHHCGPAPTIWKNEDVALVDAIATQIGVALIQAEAYANLQELNEQLAALDRTRSNLVAITGHELRTPLSTIQVCLESLATEPDMPQELRQVMLNTALTDAERMRKLVQDFLTLSRLEGGRIDWNSEPLSLAECVELSLSHTRAHNRHNILPKIINRVSEELPLVQADGEWLVELLTKLLDNAVKFTSPEGEIAIAVGTSDLNAQNQSHHLEVTVSDTGRGIEPNRLETVFDRFYQEEGSLRRSKGGTGLGLAICRQIVNGWGGKIWAESDGKNLGSKFHFTIPIFNESFLNSTPIKEEVTVLPTKTRRTNRKKKTT